MSTPSEYTSEPGNQVHHYAIPAPSGRYGPDAGRRSDRWPWVAVALIAAIAAIAVAFIIFLGNRPQTAVVRTVAQVAAHHSPAHRVITRTVTRPSTTVIRGQVASSAAPSDSSAALGSCGGGINVNSNTSCPFAQNVVDQYEQQAAGAPSSFDVYAYSPVTGQSYTDACTYSSSSATVSCSHGSDLIQFAYSDVQGSAAGSQASGSGSGSGSCTGISINAATSCPFAQNMVDEYMSEVGAGSPGSLDVQAYSPVTGKNYSDTCSYTSSDDMVSCSHGSDLIQFAYGSH